MRILAFSDTHGRIGDCIKVLNTVRGVDMVLHAGDRAADAEALAQRFSSIEFWYVSGNNDFYSNAPKNRIIDAGGVKIFLTHGHYERVKRDFSALAAKARLAGADLAIFGHTHIPYYGYENGMRLLNPGTFGYSPKSYAVIEITSGGLKTAIIPYRA